jgi:simple sugar transport system permease protein
MAKPAASGDVAVRDRAAAGAERRSLWARLGEAFLARREASIFIVAVALALYFQSSNSAFLTKGNIRTISEFTAATAIISAGLVMLLICGEIDLSVGQAFGFAPIIMYLADQQLVLPAAIVVALLVTAAVGLVNGAVTVYLRVPSFITTLGMFFLLGGLNVTLTDGFPKPAPEQSGLTQALGGADWTGIGWAIVVVVLMHILLNHTRWGLHTFATGGNLVGASEAGVKVGMIKIGNFMLCAMLGGFAGILEAIRIDSIDPLAGGPDIMFMAVSAAVIGGTALAGGIGTVVGAFFGVVVLSILQNGFTLQGVSAYTFDIILGIAILAAMTLNVYVGRLRRGGRRT